MEKTKKILIGEETLSFKMTNRTILKVDEKYGNYGSVIAGVIEGNQFYTNALKLLSCCCIDRELDLDELVEKLTPSQMNYEITVAVAELYYDYIDIGKAEETETKKEKN